MSTVLTRDEVRQKIDLLEALENTITVIEDVSSVEFEAGEQHALDMQVTARDTKKSPVAFAHGLPHDVLLAGLQAMREKLEGRLA